MLCNKEKAARAGLLRQRTPLQGVRANFLGETALTAVLYGFLGGSTPWLRTASAREPHLLTAHLGQGFASRSCAGTAVWSIPVSQVRAARHRGPEMHRTGGVSAERSSSRAGSKGDEGAVSGCPGTRLFISLAPSPHPADSPKALVRYCRRVLGTLRGGSQCPCGLNIFQPQGIGIWRRFRGCLPCRLPIPSASRWCS